MCQMLEQSLVAQADRSNLTDSPGHAGSRHVVLQGSGGDAPLGHRWNDALRDPCRET